MSPNFTLASFTELESPLFVNRLPPAHVLFSGLCGAPGRLGKASQARRFIPYTLNKAPTARLLEKKLDFFGRTTIRVNSVAQLLPDTLIGTEPCCWIASPAAAARMQSWPGMLVSVISGS
jgi:hypothetical protein